MTGGQLADPAAGPTNRLTLALTSKMSRPSARITQKIDHRPIWRTPHDSRAHRADQRQPLRLGHARNLTATGRVSPVLALGRQPQRCERRSTSPRRELLLQRASAEPSILRHGERIARLDGHIHSLLLDVTLGASPSPPPPAPGTPINDGQLLHGLWQAASGFVSHNPGLASLAVLVLVATFAESVRVAIHTGRKDPNRRFSRSDRSFILSRAGQRCEHHALVGRCRATKNLEADHIHPHSRGGWPVSRTDRHSARRTTARNVRSSPMTSNCVAWNVVARHTFQRRPPGLPGGVATMNTQAPAQNLRCGGDPCGRPDIGGVGRPQGSPPHPTPVSTRELNAQQTPRRARRARSTTRA